MLAPDRSSLADLTTEAVITVQRHYLDIGVLPALCVGVEALLGSLSANHTELFDPRFPAHTKPKFEQAAHLLREDGGIARALAQNGSVATSLADQSHLHVDAPLNARYFYAVNGRVDVLYEPPGYRPAQHALRLRCWAFHTDRPSIGALPLVLREVADHLIGTATARYHDASLPTFFTATERGAVGPALEVLAELFHVDGVVLWQYDEFQRRFRSMGTHGMEGKVLNVPAEDAAGDDRHGIISQIRPDRRLVVYDTKDTEAWRPPHKGNWQPFDRDLFPTFKWRSSLAAPVVCEGRLVGALSVYSARPVSEIMKLGDDLTHAAALSAQAVMLERDRTVVRELTERYDEQLLTANVSLGALSLSHDILHYFRTVSFGIEQCRAYVQTRQLREAVEQLDQIAATMERTEPVVNAMRKLATEATDPESSSPQRTTPDVGDVLAELETLLKVTLPHYSKGPRLKEEDIKIGVHGTVRPVAISSVALERIVMNLAVNAAQWRARTITVTANFERSDTEMHLVVRDDGRGIPDTQRSRVFDRFFSGRNGTGLGLYVVKSLAQRAGGDVHLQSLDPSESIEHRGTIITIVLPTVA